MKKIIKEWIRENKDKELAYWWENDNGKQERTIIYVSDLLDYVDTDKIETLEELEEQLRDNISTLASESIIYLSTAYAYMLDNNLHDIPSEANNIYEWVWIELGDDIDNNLSELSFNESDYIMEVLE